MTSAGCQTTYEERNDAVDSGGRVIKNNIIGDMPSAIADAAKQGGNEFIRAILR